MVRVHKDDNFRAVSLVLALLGTLALLSFVMAGVVGAREKSASPVAGEISSGTVVSASAAPAS